MTNQIRIKSKSFIYSAFLFHDLNAPLLIFVHLTRMEFYPKVVAGIRLALRMNARWLNHDHHYHPAILLKLFLIMNYHERRILYRRTVSYLKDRKKHFFKGKIPYEDWMKIIHHKGLGEWYKRIYYAFEGGCGLVGARCRGTGRLNLLMRENKMPDSDRRILTGMVNKYW